LLEGQPGRKAVRPLGMKVDDVEMPGSDNLPKRRNAAEIKIVPNDDGTAPNAQILTFCEQ
jgi:hypothetical protein